MLCQKEHLFILCALFLLLASFAGQRAVITNISIEGPSEHTLVIPPDYPEYTQVFSCMVTWTTEGEPDVEKEEMEADFRLSYEWSVSGCEIVGSNTEETVTVRYKEENDSDALISCTVTIRSENNFGIGTPQHLDPQIFDSEHYSHSRQFRSFSAEMWDYWDLVYKITTSDQNWQVPVIPSRMFD